MRVMTNQQKAMLKRIIFGVLIFVSGCAPTLNWVPEPFSYPSCSPNRLPTWDDFSKKAIEEKSPKIGSTDIAAQINLEFLLNDSLPYIRVRLNPQRSWARPEVLNPQNSTEWSNSQKILAHEQVHYLISCLLVRQGNQSLLHGEDPQAMFQHVQIVNTRINLQYDHDTEHGRNEEAQAKWEADVQEQFEDVTAQDGKKVVE